jgi:hypothetical protein
MKKSLLITTIIFPFLFLILNSNAVFAATETISLIRQDCAGYSNCYTSLASWEAARQRNLVALNELEIAQIDGTWTNPDTIAVTIDG